MFKVTLNIKNIAIKLYSFQYLGMYDFFEENHRTFTGQGNDLLHKT